MKQNEIRSAMVLLGITGMWVANKTGYSKQYVSLVIQGSRRNHVIEECIANAINRPVAEVFPDHKEAA